MASTVESSNQSDIEQPQLYEDVIEATVDGLKSKIDEGNYSIADLEKIKRVEKENKDRKTAIKFLNKTIEKQVETEIGNGEVEEENKSDSGECKEELESVENELENRLESIENKLEESESIEENREGESIEIGALRIQIYEGDPILLLDRGNEIIELKHYHLIDFIRGDISDNLSNESSEEKDDLQKIAKEYEDSNKRKREDNGSTVTEKNTADINNEEKASPEASGVNAARNGGEPTEIEKLRKELKEDYNLEEQDLEGKTLDELKELKERVADKQKIKEEIKEKFDVNPGDKSLDELEDLRDELQKTENKRLDLLNKYEVEESRLKGKNLNQLEDIEEELGKKDKLINRLKAYGFTNDELESLDVEDLEKKISEIDRKKNLLEELDADMDDSEIKEIELDDLKKLKREKKERTEMIESLKEQGFDETELKNCSTEDLRKFSSETTERQETIEETDKTVEEMEEQASDDLELLKGAVPASETEDDSPNKKNIKEKAISKVNSWKSEFSDVRSSSKEEKSDKEIRKHKLLDLLEEYKQLDNNVEKSVKTAQVMKGFIEHSLDIRRELTYKEVAERVENLGQDKDDEGLIELSRFFSDIHNQIYSGKVYIENIDEVLEISKNTVKSF